MSDVNNSAGPGGPAGLHGLWEAGVGLLVWSTEESRVRALAHMLGRRPPRHHAQVLVDPVAGTVERYRAIGFAPDGAAEYLSGLAADPDRPDICADLRYLALVVAGLQRWAHAGLVVPEVTAQDGQWSPRWRLLGTMRQRAWQAEWIAAMPPVLFGHGGPNEPPATRATGVFLDFTQALADAVVRRELGAMDSASRQWRHPLIAALVSGQELSGQSHSTHGPRVANRLEAWRESLQAGEPTLVLRLVEPVEQELGTSARRGGQPGDEPGDDAVPIWRLQVCLRADGEAPTPVVLHRTDRESIHRALTELTRAMDAYPLLKELPRDLDSLDLLLPSPAVTDLVRHGAHALTESGITMLLPRAWRVMTPSLRVHVSTPEVSVRSSDSEVGMAQLLDFDVRLALGDQLLWPDEVAELVRQQGGLVRLRGEWVQADADALAAAAEYLETQRGSPATLARLMNMLAVDPPPVPVSEVSATGWVDTLLRGVGREGDGSVRGPGQAAISAPAGLTATLRPYQLRGLQWLSFMSERGLGAVLADDMGLGKTIQLLALLLHERESTQERPAATLLVCPMSVVGNWQREAETFAPSLRVLVQHGPDRAKGEQLARQVSSADLVITTYALLARDVDELKALTFDRVVLDEAQHVKNERTSQSRAVRQLAVRHRLALTGTPVENRLAELRAILNFANPGMLGSAAKFRAAFAVPIEADRDEEAAARLRAATAPFILRRVKTDPTVIDDLPAKQEMTVRVNLTQVQATLYQAVLDDMQGKIEGATGMARRGAVLTALLRLKQVCNHPAQFHSDGSPLLRRAEHRSGKLALVEDIIDGVVGDDERILLFTQFREFGAMLTPWLAKRFDTDSIPFLHGGASKTARDKMVARFQEGEGPPIMVLSLKAGGTGINLTAANHVVHLDRWWNPAVENQATDRAFRIGQQRAVQVRKLVCVETLEERIDAMLYGKRELAELSLGAGEGWVSELSDAALRDLLRLGKEAVGE